MSPSRPQGGAPGLASLSVTSATPLERTYRPEVQGLRAVAVGLVVLYHFWPNRIPGGFVGVDVFFVISGFLITSHLMKEVVRDGTVSLREFWARRIRRLLPASLLVLAVCAVATYLWVLPTHWAATARQLIASALYVQNWALAADAVDYLALGEAPTIAQHFWSLSVEEQFYVVWPLLLVAGLALARRLRPGADRVRTAAIVIAGVGGASFVTSVWMTAAASAWAYFATPTRIWELALGAGLALVAVRLGRLARIALGWVGIAAIVASALMLDGDSAFPGWVAAFPTLGAAAVIAAGRTQSRLGADRWLSLRPATFVGDISYAVYLWHWPVVVVAPFALARSLGFVDKVVAIGLVTLLSWGTKVWVEDRFRTPRAGQRGVARTYALAAAGMVLVLSLGFALRAQLDARVEAAEAAAASLPAECVGPGALADPEGCGGIMGPGLLLVSPPEAVALQSEDPAYPGCQQDLHGAEVLTCALGSDDPEPDGVVVLVGDSHGTQWFPALDRLGQDENLRIETYTKASCPPSAAARATGVAESEGDLEACREWLGEVRDRVLSSAPDLVLVTAYSSQYEYGVPADDLLGESSAVEQDPAVAGFAQYWRAWLERDVPVATIAAIPRTQGANVPDCLAGHANDFAACATSRLESAAPDPLLAAAEQAGAGVVDLTDHFCDATTCYPVVGNVIVYRDYSHLSHEYATALAPFLGAAIEEWLPSG